MNIFNNKDIFYNILNPLLSYQHNLLTLRLVSNVFKTYLIKKYYLLLKNIYFKNLRHNYNTYIILRNIKNKLYLANLISDDFYNIIDPSNLYNFNKSISWNISSIDNENWYDLFLFNTIVWNNDELNFLKIHYGITII